MRRRSEKNSGLYTWLIKIAFTHARFFSSLVLYFPTPWPTHTHTHTVWLCPFATSLTERHKRKKKRISLRNFFFFVVILAAQGFPSFALIIISITDGIYTNTRPDFVKRKNFSISVLFYFLFFFGWDDINTTTANAIYTRYMLSREYWWRLF